MVRHRQKQGRYLYPGGLGNAASRLAAPGSARRQTGAKGKHRSQLLLCFPHKVKQGRGNSLALTSLNNVGALYAIGVVSSCLVPGPG